MSSSIYKMLIVDDERAIVNGLVSLFEDEPDLQLEIFRAYSGLEAYEFLQRHPVDIVMSDIRMPGMSGLELQRQVKELWPGCQFIFLTGYNDFHYAQEAMRNEGADYILKTEEDATIIQAVHKVIGRLERQFEINAFMAQAGNRLKQALPVLQKEFMWELLQGEGSSDDQQFLRQMEELEIPLSPDRPVLLVLVRVDDWGNKIHASDQTLMLYAMTNIVQEYLSPIAELYPLTYEQSKLVLLIQAKDPGERGASGAVQSTLPPPKRIALFVNNILESVLAACKQYLDLTISMLAAKEAVPWQACRQKFKRLRRLLLIDCAMRQEIALSESNLEDEEQAESKPDASVQLQLGKISMLETYLETGQREHFFGLFFELMKLAQEPDYVSNGLKLHLYYALVSIYLAYLHQSGTMHDLDSRLDIHKLTRMEEHEGWDEATRFLQQTAERIFSHKTADLAERDREVIRKIKRYVEQNLAGDLSLTRIAEVAGFNRSYLSRLYKQMTGKGLSEYILEVRLLKAKELLRQHQLKVHEISDVLGFESSAYFTRFFKRATNLTPTEFRELDH